MILLDPESHGVKNTKHLASLCSFPSTWITYAYSMRDSKSPLKAVLEGITSRHPDWTVGHLAEMFRVMERHDAIAVLRKLDVKLLDVWGVSPQALDCTCLSFLTHAFLFSFSTNPKEPKIYDHLFLAIITVCTLKRWERFFNKHIHIINLNNDWIFFLFFHKKHPETS